MVLEYLKVFLTSSVLFSVTAIVFIFIFKEDIKSLMLRIAKIKLPGGAELSTTQSARTSEESAATVESPIEGTQSVQGLPSDLSPPQRQVVEQLIRGHIAMIFPQFNGPLTSG